MLSLFRHPQRPLTPIESLEALIKRNLARNPDFYGNAETRRARAAGHEPPTALVAGYGAAFLTANELRGLAPARAQGHSNFAITSVMAATDMTSEQFRAFARTIHGQVRFMNGQRPPAVNVEDPRPHVPIEDQILLREGTR